MIFMKKNIFKIIALFLVFATCLGGVYFVYDWRMGMSRQNGQYELSSTKSKNIVSHKLKSLKS